MDLHLRVDHLRATLRSFVAATSDDGLQAVAQQLTQELGAVKDFLRDPLSRRARDDAARYAARRLPHCFL